MTRNILVPVDFSQRSREALHYAADLAAKLRAGLTILHAWDCPPFARTAHVASAPGARHEPLDQLVVKAAQREFDTFVASAQLDPSLKPKLVLSPLSPIRAVLEAVEHDHQDLIVMATHGRGSAMILLLGSVAKRVVELSPVPVLLVPDGASRRLALRDAAT